MAFNGYLIRFKNTDNTYTELPLKWMRYESYKVEKNTMDLDPTRSLTGLLYRNPLSHTASKIEFNIPSMTNTQVEQFMSLLRSKYRNPLEKDVYLQYYLPEDNSYHEGHFYVPDIGFTIRNVDTARNIINYNETRVAFIEY